MHNTPTHTRFIVEGNIGAGKSTFLRMMSQYLNVQVVFEPHEKWQKVVGNENLLDKFYKDMPRWAYTFQSYAFITRIMEQEQQAKRNPYAVQVVERSVFSDRYCFAKNCYETGSMTELEWQLYTEWFGWLSETHVEKPTGFIYLRTNPVVCHERLVKRSRDEELGVTLRYLQQLHEKHEAWLVRTHEVSELVKHVPVLVLECDEDFEHNTAQLEQHLEQVIVFMRDRVPQATRVESSQFLSL